MGWCLGRVALLRAHGVTPLIVFDGAALPAKEGENAQRRAARHQARELARQLWRQGNRTAALEAYQRAVSITSAHGHRLRRALARLTPPVECLVAPYEADAQLAYLARTGLVDAVLTEDSDLLCYGAAAMDRCAVLFKLDRCGGVQEVLLSNLDRCREMDLRGWGPAAPVGAPVGGALPVPTVKADGVGGAGPPTTPAAPGPGTALALHCAPAPPGAGGGAGGGPGSGGRFRELCILAGCDFLPNIRGIGLRKAHQALAKWGGFARVCKQLRFGAVSPPRGYEAGVQRALWTFAHQRVWCPKGGRIVHLWPLRNGVLEADPELRALFPAAAVEALAGGDAFLGPDLGHEAARRICAGTHDPRTGAAFPDPVPAPGPQRGVGGGGLGGSGATASGRNGSGGGGHGGWAFGAGRVLPPPPAAGYRQISGFFGAPRGGADKPFRPPAVGGGGGGGGGAGPSACAHRVRLPRRDAASSDSASLAAERTSISLDMYLA